MIDQSDLQMSTENLAGKETENLLELDFHTRFAGSKNICWKEHSKRLVGIELKQLASSTFIGSYSMRN